MPWVTDVDPRVSRSSPPAQPKDHPHDQVLAQCPATMALRCLGGGGMTTPTQAATVEIPGPQGSRFTGMTSDIRRDLLGTYERAAAEHGDVVRIVAGVPGRKIALHLVTHPDGVQHVLAGGSD